MTRGSRSRHPTTTSAGRRTSSSPRSTDSASIPRGASRSTPARRRADSRRCCSRRGARTVLAVDVGHGQLAARTRGRRGARARRGVQRAAPRRRPARRAHRRRRAADAGHGRSLVHLAHDRAARPARDRGRRRRLRAAREAAVRSRPRRACAKASCGMPHSAPNAVANVLWAAFDLGLGTAGILSSPIAGTHGNHEYLVHLSPVAGRQSDRMVESQSSN